jgi:hypothetical protein
MKHALFLIIAFTACSASRAGAEPFGYSGKVVDSAGNGIPWAFLKVSGSDAIGQSNADGSFNLTGNATTTFYADPRPKAPVPAAFARASVPVLYLATGRAASGATVASTLLFRADGGIGSPSRGPGLAGASRVRGFSDTLRSPAAPPAEQAAAAFTLNANMAHFRTGIFPQAAATAKSLVLVLSAYETDTAMYAAEKKLCLDTINAYRKKAGLQPVAWSKSLEAFADQGARWDAERNDPHGHFGAFKGPTDAENEVPGWPLKSYKTVGAVVAKGAEMMWGEGPGGGHYENIKGGHTQLGCGIHVTATGAVWVIHDFR